ncbi:hypothetical protein R0J87_19295, partial [Halomonas sp. SIMBA_159]
MVYLLMKSIFMKWAQPMPLLLEHPPPRVDRLTDVLSPADEDPLASLGVRLERLDIVGLAAEVAPQRTEREL